MLVSQVRISCRRPLVLVVEDSEHIDEDSVEVSPRAAMGWLASSTSSLLLPVPPSGESHSDNLRLCRLPSRNPNRIPLLRPDDMTSQVLGRLALRLPSSACFVVLGCRWRDGEVAHATMRGWLPGCTRRTWQGEKSNSLAY